MNDEQFKSLLERRLVLTAQVLAGKATEYSAATDRLHNFTRAAAALGSTRAQALIGMWMKHIISVLDIAQQDKQVTRAMIDEKIGDAINYLILLEAVLNEDQTGKEQ